MDIDYSKYSRAIQESVQDKEVRDEPQQERQKELSGLLQPIEMESFRESFPAFTKLVGKKVFNQASKVVGPKGKAILNKIRDVSNDYEEGGIQNVINRHANDVRTSITNTVRNRISPPEPEAESIEMDNMEDIEPTITNALELPGMPADIPASESLMSRLIASGQSRIPQLSTEEMNALPDFSGLSGQDSLAPMRNLMGSRGTSGGTLASQQDMDSVAQTVNPDNIVDSGLSAGQDLGDSLAGVASSVSGDAVGAAGIASDAASTASKTLSQIALDTAPEVDEIPGGVIVSGLLGIASLFSSVFGHSGSGEINASTQFGTGL